MSGIPTPKKKRKSVGRMIPKHMETIKKNESHETTIKNYNHPFCDVYWSNGARPMPAQLFGATHAESTEAGPWRYQEASQT